MGVVGGGSIRWNPYAYAGGNPVNYVDPSGEFPWLAVGLVALWFARGAAVDVGVQMTLGGRSFDQVDWGSAAISGGIDVFTGGLGSYAKAAGAGVKLINRLDFGADVLLSSAADVAFYGDDPLSALAGNAFFGGLFRAGIHHGGRAVNSVWNRPGHPTTAGNPVSAGLSAAPSTGRVRTARPSDMEGGVSLLKRRAWFSDQGDIRPDLSRVEAALRSVFENPIYHPSKGICHQCADEAGSILQTAGYDVDIVKLEAVAADASVGRGGTMFQNRPDGGEWKITSMGWHEAVRIKFEGEEYFLDTAAYLNTWEVRPLTRREYARLWGPGGADSNYTAYFYSRMPGEPSTGYVPDLPSDRRILATGK